MADPRRFIGRPAKTCGKCGSKNAYVNRMGGVVCETCEPAKKAGDSILRLVLTPSGDGRSSQWDDADNPWDAAGSGEKQPPLWHPPTASKSPGQNPTRTEAFAQFMDELIPEYIEINLSAFSESVGGDGVADGASGSGWHTPLVLCGEFKAFFGK